MRISDWSSDVCSSDLPAWQGRSGHNAEIPPRISRLPRWQKHRSCPSPALPSVPADPCSYQTGRRCSPTIQRVRIGWWYATARSEEHTSELQSLMRISSAVFCLQKKTKTYQLSSPYLQLH